MSNPAQANSEFAVCVNNQGYEASLEVGKLYRIVADPASEAEGLLRIIDESGEDYGFSVDRFYRLDIPRELVEVLHRAA